MAAVAHVRPRDPRYLTSANSIFPLPFHLLTLADCENTMHPTQQSNGARRGCNLQNGGDHRDEADGKTYHAGASFTCSRKRDDTCDFPPYLKSRLIEVTPARALMNSFLNGKSDLMQDKSTFFFVCFL